MNKYTLYKHVFREILINFVPDNDVLAEVIKTPDKIIMAWFNVNSVNISQSMFIWLRASLHWHWLVLHDPVYSSQYTALYTALYRHEPTVS